MIANVLATVLAFTVVALAVIAVLGIYRELDELRHRVVVLEWRADGEPPMPAAVAGVGWTKRTLRWLRRLDVARVRSWVGRIGHHGEHRA